MSIVREITVIDQSTSSRKTIKDVSPTNFAELKEVLRNNGFNPDGKSVIEAVSSISFVSDDAQLPTNIMWKGTPTNNLVIMITPLKKTASGTISAARKSFYETITKHNLGSDIKRRVGRPYTNLSNQDLSLLINELLPPQTEAVKVPMSDDLSKVIYDLQERVAALEGEVYSEYRSSKHEEYYIDSETYTEEDIEDLIDKFNE